MATNRKNKYELMEARVTFLVSLWQFWSPPDTCLEIIACIPSAQKEMWNGAFTFSEDLLFGTVNQSS